MSQERREEVALFYDRAALELETGARHLRRAAAHFRDGEVPRGCAHAFAAVGHARRAERQYGAAAETHAERSTPDG